MFRFHRKISHGSGQMRAQSISIQVSNRERCSAGCVFCISRTTPDGLPQVGREIKLCNLDRLAVGLGYAKQLGATHAILTGRADPTQEEIEYLTQVTRLCREHLPLVDMHTNGFLLQPGMPKMGALETLTKAGLTMVTFSIASFNSGLNRQLMLQKHSAADLIPIAREQGLLVRSSLVMNKTGVHDFEGVLEYIRQAGRLGVQMVVIREIWLPDVYGEYNTEVFWWNQANRVLIAPVQKQFIRAAKDPENPHGIHQRDPLPWGTPVFTVRGIFKNKPEHSVNVTFARCDEATTGTVIKSIVHKPDGHGYRNWDDIGDILY